MVEGDCDRNELSDSSNSIEENEDSSVNWENNKDIVKFYTRRYSLFSKFDQGIKLDRESWFSVTPEKIAQNTAKRCQCDTIVDAFCGAGGNTIQFAKTCKKVIAIDIDPQKVELARHNAEIYGVTDRIQFIVGDFFKLADTLEADVVFLSPPWGGLQYKKYRRYNLQRLQPKPFDDLWETARKITPNLAFYLPKNSNTYPLVVAPGSNAVEVEQNILGGFVIAITAYFGNLIKKPITLEESEGE
ncbi:hypothetical protein ILUMI_19059 [Ignelater luminosus]|uniref:Trimethylguanosine synthase n=1 Tax=Ignelater luminosus TaxID=2038154 RepID=A0A8K0G5T7_IGNLU|nr:hypothetical protein ILUMI_19059 [Ignelater luminosus]